MADSKWAPNLELQCLNCGGFLQAVSSDNTYLNIPTLPHHLLTTNYPPSDAESVALHDSMDAARTCISNIDASMVKLEGMLEKLRKQRKHAFELIRRGSGILSVIRQLPGDVLGEIFSHTIGDVPRRGILRRSPWVLGRVCRRWRATSLALPTLWSNIDSGLPMPILQAHLERSGACGLTIRLIYSDSDMKAMGSIIDCSSRWESADIQMGTNILPILERIRSKVPMLRHLKYGDSTDVESCTAFQIAPKLSSVVITGTGKPPLHLPWAQITHLRQRIPNVDGLSQLATARNVVELTLTNLVSLTLSLALARGLLEAPILELPCLRTLFVDDGEFLNFLVLPALEDIYLSHRTWTLVSLIERSACLLRRFTTEEQCGFPDLFPILHHTPALLDLRLMPLESDFLLSRLTIAPPEPRLLCPNLRSISLCNITSQNQCASVVEMVESRRASAECANPSLSILNLSNTELNAHELDALRRLRSEGAEVEWLPAKPARRRLIDWQGGYP
ncbi:hypothetical protein FB451DRAFT_142534 [Mycena latifolia]|nr:hypothetical protein FB451DRAFT_142534 [Mycena latifolia]